MKVYYLKCVIKALLTASGSSFLLPHTLLTYTSAFPDAGLHWALKLSPAPIAKCPPEAGRWHELDYPQNIQVLSFPARVGPGSLIISPLFSLQPSVVFL